MRSSITIMALALGCWCCHAAGGETRFWLENAIAYHGFTVEEASQATGLPVAKVKSLAAEYGMTAGRRPARKPGEPLCVMPYPGGRHPRIGFLEGAVNPDRGTKASIFLPWKNAGYIVLDLPEAIWSNLGLTYLAHTHLPTIWDKKKVKLPKVAWKRTPTGELTNELTLPNGITFGSRITPRPETIDFELWIKNETPEPLTNLRSQVCLMLKGAPAFEQQIKDNKTRVGRCVACRSQDGTRWIALAWENGRVWDNPPVPCMHSDPTFPDAPPGRTVRDRGRLFFYAGKDIKAEIARRIATGTLFGEPKKKP